MLKRSLLACALLPLWAPAHATPELDALRAEILAMKSQYESRLAELENRLKQAEAQPAPQAAAAPSDRHGQVGAGTSFNPQISVILDGVYFNDNKKGESIELFEHLDGINHSHDHEGHSHAELERGFNLRETELAFSATVDPYFDANMFLAVDSGGGVEVEEAYFDTRSLPAGLKLRGGKFLSGIGYANSQHPHSWEFTDSTLPYRTLLGEHGLMDTGMRLTWLPKTGNVYTLLGMELFQGDEQLIAGAGEELPEDIAGSGFGGLADSKAGPRLTTLYAKIAPDLGDDHALQFGLWGAKGRQLQEVHDHRADDPTAAVHGLEGDAQAWGADLVYKYDAPGAYGQGDFSLVAEYLRANKDLHVAYHQTDAALLGAQRDFTQDGFYIQGVYGFAPRWQAGLRYDVSGLTNELDRGSSVTKWDQSDRWTLALTHRFSEFSLLRFQASTADLSVDGDKERANQFFVQYQHSLGAHGAHGF
jgi:hypothetical protein